VVAVIVLAVLGHLTGVGELTFDTSLKYISLITVNHCLGGIVINVNVIINVK
jgi:hypothetical protein